MRRCYCRLRRLKRVRGWRDPPRPERFDKRCPGFAVGEHRYCRIVCSERIA